MPLQDHIDVRIIIDGKPVPEYQDPEGDEDSPDLMKRYIEIVAGQTFSVQIKWTAGFRLEDAAYLYGCFEVDDGDSKYYRVVPTTKVHSDNGILINDQIRLIGSVLYQEDDTSEWQSYPFTFGALGIVENDNIEIDHSPSAVNLLGSIRVSVFRAQMVERVRCLDIKKPKPIEVVTEKMLKGRGLKNNIILTAGIPRSPPPYRDRYMPVTGEHGKTCKFTFLYRSRKLLQSIGCIPRSPSPPPDKDLILGRYEAMLRTSKQEVGEANLGVLRMQDPTDGVERKTRKNYVIDLDGVSTTSATGHGEGGVKLEVAIRAKPEAVVKAEASTNELPLRGKKRQRECDDDVLFVSQPPPCFFKPRIEIDLTGDDE